MKSEECINTIKDRLLALINSGQLKAKYRASESTFSFYFNDIDLGERPLLTLRLADHNPTYQNYVNRNLTPPSEGYNVNMSIEFFKPKFKPNGRIKRNRLNADVNVPQDVHGVVPFFVNSYEYIPEKLEEADIEKIYDAILSWIYGGLNAEYIDPFANTSKEAKTQSRISNITWNIAHNISVDKDGNYVSANGWGADFVSESMINKKLNCNRNMNKKLIRLTESDLHRIVRESVNKVLNEIGDTKRGQNLIGQVAARAMHRGDYQTMFDALDRRSKEDDTNFIHGHNDRLDVINNPDTSSKEGRRARLKMQNNYEVADMEDMDAIGRKFINFIEKHGGGVMMQTIADYESGNQTGRPESGFPAVLEVFEDEVLGYDCSPKIKTALKRAYTQWWHYAQDELMPDEEY